MGAERKAQDIIEGKKQKGFVRNLLPFLGPAFIASVAYVDPGNFATNIQGGSSYGYALLWVILSSNLMAMLLQSMSAKLGIATGRNLAEHCRDRFSKSTSRFLWILMELVAMATDLAEFIGAAVGFSLLFGMPMWIAGLATALATFLILGLQRWGVRPLEAVITGFVAIIAIGYLVEIFLAKPDWAQAARGAFIPGFPAPGAALLAAGILGATVMPHAIFLHSSLTQNRVATRSQKQKKRLFHFEVADVVIAMGISSLINMAMLLMAASTFFATGRTEVGTLESAHETLIPLLGPAAGILFAVSLLASGLSSSSVGTMAGQVIMQGFIKKEIPPWLRRLVTMLPSLVVIFIGLDPTRTLVISQVLLSFGLPFAIIPLLLFTSNKKLMGELANRKLTIVLGCVSAVLVIALNLFLVYQTFVGG